MQTSGAMAPREQRVMFRRHCEEAIQRRVRGSGLLRSARNDGGVLLIVSIGPQAATGIFAPALRASRGRETRTTVPAPSFERSFMEPPCSWVSDLAIARPSPEP